MSGAQDMSFTRNNAVSFALAEHKNLCSCESSSLYS